METLSALLALCDENPPAIGTFWKIIYEFHLFTGPLTGRSPKVVALFSATNFSSYIIELLQLHDTIQIK